LCEEAIEHARTTRQVELLSTALGTLAEIGVAEGDRTAAFIAWSEALDIAWTVGNEHILVDVIESVAVALADIEPRVAARTLSVADTLREERGMARPEVYQAENDRALSQCRALVGNDGVDRAIRAGREMHLREIVQELRLHCDSAAISPPVEPATGGLSPREVEVLRLVVNGQSDREIGDALFVSRRTAASHVASILEKLGVTSRVAAAAEAVRRGLV
jgi:DNA-binding CsgD family transcriptional regulator